MAFTNLPPDFDPVHYVRFSQGDSEAFAGIVRAYQGEAFRLAYLWTGRQSLADDVVQEAFWKSWQHRRQLRDPTRFPAWFLRILANTYKDLIRRERTSLEFENPSLADPQANPEERLLLDDERRTLGRALSSLRTDDRLALILRYYDGLSIQEIANILGRPPNTVLSRIHRALHRLRQTWTLGEEGKNHEPTAHISSR